MVVSPLPAQEYSPQVVIFLEKIERPPFEATLRFESIFLQGPYSSQEIPPAAQEIKTGELSERQFLAGMAEVAGKAPD